MKHIHFIAAALFSLVLLIPAVSSARPGGVPPQCITSRGYVDCQNPNCRIFCQGSQSRRVVYHNNTGSNVVHRVTTTTTRPSVVVTQRPVVVPQPVVVTRPVVTPPPVVVQHQQPSVIVVDSDRYDKRELRRQIRELKRANKHLDRDLDKAKDRAQYNYDVCRSSVPYYAADRCVYDDTEIRSIRHQIKANKRELKRLEKYRDRYDDRYDDDYYYEYDD